MSELSKLKGVKAPKYEAPHFREFVVDFSGTGMNVSDINKHLLKGGIFGGMDLSNTGAGLENCALYCVTEIHTQRDIDRLVTALKELLR